MVDNPQKVPFFRAFQAFFSYLTIKITNWVKLGEKIAN